MRKSKEFQESFNTNKGQVVEPIAQKLIHRLIKTMNENYKEEAR